MSDWRAVSMALGLLVALLTGGQALASDEYGDKRDDKRGAGRHLTVAAYNMPYILNQEGTGTYNRVLEELSRRAGIEFNLEILPIARARAAFRAGEYDCLLPLDRIFEPRYHGHVQSLPFNYAQAYIFTAQGQQPLTDLDQLRGKRVGIETGFPLPPKMAAQLDLTPVVRLENLLRMLHHGRIDAIIAYAPSLKQLTNNVGRPMPAYNPHRPLFTYRDSLTCRPTARNNTLLQQLDHCLGQMLAEGEVHRMTALNIDVTY